MLRERVEDYHANGRDSKDNNIIIIIPTYNETENIAPLIERLFYVDINLFILILDDNSPDGTAKIVEKLQKRYSNIRLIIRKCRLGLGSAYRDGFRYALDNGYEVIVQMDADLSHSPEYIPYMVSLLEEYDLVVGSRYVKGGGISQWPLVRLLLSRLANMFAKALLHVPINDLTSGFKCMRREVLEKIDFSTIKSQGYAFQIEMVYRAYLKGLRITEYPIVFKEREKNRSKMSFGIIIEAFLRVILLSIEKVFYRI